MKAASASSGCALRAYRRRQAVDRFRASPRRDLRDDAPEGRAVRVGAAAGHDEVLRHGAGAELADAALEADAPRRDAGRSRSGSR